MAPIGGEGQTAEYAPLLKGRRGGAVHSHGGIGGERGLFRGARLAFIMEMTLYHLPNGRTIGLYVWHNAWAFVRKAGTMKATARTD
jgi:hypothetical protein